MSKFIAIWLLFVLGCNATPETQTSISSVNKRADISLESYLSKSKVENGVTYTLVSCSPPSNSSFPKHKWPYAQTPDGCSGLTRPGETRDTWGTPPLMVDFRPACNTHDINYYTVDHKVTKYEPAREYEVNHQSSIFY